MELATNEAHASTPAHKLPAHENVVLFTNSFLMGGMEEHVALVARELVRRGRRVGVICSSRPEIAGLRADLASAGAAVFALDEHPRSFRGMIARLLDLRQVLRQFPNAVLHLHLTGFEGGELVVLAARLERLRSVVRTEHLPPLGPQPLKLRLRARLRDGFMRRVICVSIQNREDHIRLLSRSPRKLTVVPNGVDVHRFSPAIEGARVRAELGLDERVPVVGVIGRLSERRKGADYFLEMAARVHPRYLDARFLIVGDGFLRPELEQQARDLDISDVTIFAGERHDIPEVLAALDVFVLPSTFEGAPYAALEALAAAKPVVATRVASIPQLIQDGVSGISVPIGDAAAMADAVDRMLRDPAAARRMGEAGRRIIEASYSLPAMIDRICSVYDAA